MKIASGHLAIACHDRASVRVVEPFDCSIAGDQLYFFLVESVFSLRFSFLDTI